MQRDLNALNQEFDVLIVGGGVYGACLARLAAQQGMSVALLERNDFGGAVSHNSLKIVHGGFRYIQHFDFPRIQESLNAQRAWLLAAPHLVRPMRCVVPAYGYGTRGPLAFAAGALAFNVAAVSRNRGLPGKSRLPPSGVMSRQTLVSRYPALGRNDLTGGAYWYDAQMLDANRLTLECVQDACAHGAIAANHVEVLQLRGSHGRIDGAIARDRLTGHEFEVRARVTVNSTGPSIQRLLHGGPHRLTIGRSLVWTRNVNIVTRKLFSTDDAVGVGSKRFSDAAVGKSKRLFFVTSWQDCSVVGTSHTKHDCPPEDIASHLQGDVETFQEEVNAALPGAQLEMKDLRYIHSGLTPAEDEIGRAKRSTVIDHEVTDGIRGIVSVLGIKYTTAPAVASDVLTIIARVLNSRSRVHGEFWRPLPGSVGYAAAAVDSGTMTCEPDDTAWAAGIYGSRSREMLGMIPRGDLSPAEHTFRCRVLYGIKHEMVLRLRDAVFRATDLAERGRLSSEQLGWCAGVLRSELGWTDQRHQVELNEVASSLRQLHSVQDTGPPTLFRVT